MKCAGPAWPEGGRSSHLCTSSVKQASRGRCWRPSRTGHKPKHGFQQLQPGLAGAHAAMGTRQQTSGAFQTSRLSSSTLTGSIPWRPVCAMHRALCWVPGLREKERRQSLSLGAYIPVREGRAHPEIKWPRGQRRWPGRRLQQAAKGRVG